MNIFKLYEDSFSGLSRDVWRIAIIYLVNRSGEMVIPFLSVFLTQELGFSKVESGIVLFSFGVGALMGSNIGGYLTDRIGNFRVMALSLGLMAIFFTTMVFFETFPMLCAWLLLTGMSSSMFSPAAFSAVSIWGGQDNRTRGFSLLRLAINLGLAVGPLLGGFMAESIGYQSLFIVDGMTCFIALLFLFYLLRHRDGIPATVPKNQPRARSPYKDKKLMIFLFLNLINMVAFFQILFSVPVYFKEVVMMNERLIGFFFMVNGLLVFTLEMPLVYIIEQKNKFFRPMIIGAFLIGLGYACLSLFGEPILAILLYSILVALGEVINFPLIPSLAMRRSSDHNQGKYMGAVSMMFALAFMLAPLSGLPVIEFTGYTLYFYLAASLSILSGVCLYFLRPYFED